MKTYAIAIGKSAAVNCQFAAEGLGTVEQAKEAAKEYAHGLANFIIVENDEWREGEWDRTQVLEGWHDAGTMEQGDITWK